MQKTNPHRAMVELVSSGAASGPVSALTQDKHAAFAPSPL